jgi:hypothetical protein
MDPIIAEVLDAAARDDRAALVQLLHPYIHWSRGGRTTRGRNTIFANLSDLIPPLSYEVRDGQIYRWISR